jgi:hypothetical protein
LRFGAADANIALAEGKLGEVLNACKPESR